jgi:hypothetical protein
MAAGCCPPPDHQEHLAGKQEKRESRGKAQRESSGKADPLNSPSRGCGGGKGSATGHVTCRNGDRRMSSSRMSWRRVCTGQADRASGTDGEQRRRRTVVGRAYAASQTCARGGIAQRPSRGPSLGGHPYTSNPLDLLAPVPHDGVPISFHQGVWNPGILVSWSSKSGCLKCSLSTASLE